MKILVVDDTPLVLRKVSHFLEQRGFKALTAHSGQEALEILRQDQHIDFVLTDLMMPEMNGIDLFKAAQRIDRLQDEGTAEQPKFILMTAARPDKTLKTGVGRQLQEAMDLGFLAIIHKPFNYEELIALIQATPNADTFQKGREPTTGQTEGRSTGPEKTEPETMTGLSEELIEKLQQRMMRIDRRHRKHSHVLRGLARRLDKLAQDVSQLRELVTARSSSPPPSDVSDDL